MNRVQKIVLVFGLLAVAAMCLYPPWYSEYEGTVLRRWYTPIWDAPIGNSLRSPHLDKQRLTLQVVAAAAITAAAVIALGCWR